jgi:hypothetical protein
VRYLFYVPTGILTMDSGQPHQTTIKRNGVKSNLPRSGCYTILVCFCSFVASLVNTVIVQCAGSLCKTMYLPTYLCFRKIILNNRGKVLLQTQGKYCYNYSLKLIEGSCTMASVKAAMSTSVILSTYYFRCHFSWSLYSRAANFWFWSGQCCGSGMFIPDPDFSPSRIPDPTKKWEIIGTQFLLSSLTQHAQKSQNFNISDFFKVNQ